jgi:catecholate siderophore receptor
MSLALAARVPARPSQLTRRLLSSTALCAVLVCGSGASAFAQSAETEEDSEIHEMAPISVFASPEGSFRSERSAQQKFTAPLLDTPKTVTVVPEELIEERNATSLAEALQSVPGITMGAGEGGTPNADLPNIRGFASESNIYVDGLRDNGSQTRDTFNLEAIEVVMGPGSAYGGRGSTGGMINLVTKTPQFDDFVDVSGTIGAPLSGRTTLDANYMLTDQAGARLNLMWEDGEVAGRDEVTTSSWGIAPSFALGMGTDTRATFSFYHFQTDDMPDFGHPYDTATGEPADVDRDNFYGLTVRDFQKTQVDTATIEIKHDLTENLTVRNTTRYSWSENDYIVTNPDDSAGNVANGAVWRNVKSRNSDTSNLVNQLDLYGGFETGMFTHSFDVGFEISHEQSANRNYTVATGARNCPTIGAASGFNCTSLYSPDPNDPWTGAIGPSEGSSETTVDTMAFYGFDTIEITPQWLVNLGLRYDDYSTQAESSGGRGGPFSGSNDSSFWNYQGGLVYKPLPNGSIYASIGTSSDPSGTSVGDGRDNLNANTEDLDPEESVAYELGTKWDLFDYGMALDVAVFRTEKTNSRVSDPLGSGTTVLGGEQVVDGFSIGASGNITEQWAVFGGYTYLDSEIVDDGAGTDDGNRLPNVPTNSFTMWTTYDVFPEWTIGGGALYMSRRYGNTANTRSVPEFWKFDALVEYRPMDDLAFQLNVNNVFDATYYEKPYVTHFATVAPGRSVMLTTNFTF